MNTEHGSEVAHLLAQIDMEYQAASGSLTGYTPTARHDYITARHRNIDACRKQLIPLVGQSQATELVAATIWPDFDATQTSQTTKG